MSDRKALEFRIGVLEKGVEYSIERLEFYWRELVEARRELEGLK